MHDFQKRQIIQSFELAISNGTTTLKNIVKDQVYVTDAIDNFKKSARLRCPEKLNEKMELLKMQMILSKEDSGLLMPFKQS